MFDSRRSLRAGLFLASIALALACAPKAKTTFQPKPEALDKVACIAILPFESLGDDDPGAGDAFADLLATEMMRSGRFQVMDRAESGRILAARGIYLGPTVDAQTARALGDVLGVQAVLVGAVSEYRFKPARYDRSPRPLIGLTTRLLDVKTGEPLWGTSFAGSPTTFFGDPTPPMSVAAQRVALDVSGSLSSASGTRRELPAKPCWDAKAQSVLATLAPGAGRTAPTPVPMATPVATAVAVVSTPVPTATVAATPVPAVSPTFLGADSPPRKKLTPAQTALKAKMTPAGQFTLDGIVFSTPTGTQLAPLSSAPLSDLAAVLSNHPEATLRVEGHVDPTDPGPVPLSQKRADAVVAKLLTLGVVAAQVEPKGMGGSKSLFPSFVEAMKAKNRRIEIAVVTPPSGDAVAVGVATPAGTPAATPATTPAVAAANARVKVLASKGKSAQAVKLANELKLTGTKITTIANVPEARTSTLIYFTAPFEKEAQKLAKQIPVPGGAKMTAYKTLGAGVDIVIVVGSDLK